MLFLKKTKQYGILIALDRRREVFFVEKAALYLRLSDEDRIKEGGASQSIQNQRLMLTDYAAAQGWKVVAVYNDEDYSGKNSSDNQPFKPFL